MLRARIIPSLLLQNNGLVKTTSFENPKYVGDPINAVRIFNEKEVDELSIFDIDATVSNKEPNYDLIKSIAMQSRMPLCYGGGIKTVEQAKRISSLGIEKIALSSAIINDFSLAKEIIESIGAQSLVVVLDIKKSRFGKYEVFTHNGKVRTGLNPVTFAQQLEDLGIGELIINSIDRDGTMLGYDTSLVDKMLTKLTIPVTILGGAGSLADMHQVIQNHGAIGLAAGSLFVFKGPYRAVLINYPDKTEKKNLCK